MKLTPFQESDYTSLYNFMKPIWEDTYRPILSQKQILFLLDKYFSKENIHKFRQSGYEYYKIDDVGVLVIVERETDIYVDKLYLLPSARGKGYPSFVFSQLLKRKKPLTLNVNQANARAIACYQKNGFTVIKQEKIPLANGMVNIDYVMQLAP